MEKTKHKAATIILLALFAIYLIALFKITIFKYPDVVANVLSGQLSGVRSLNITPFVTISQYLQFILNGNIIIGISNILGNLIIFFPLGYMAALLFPKMRKSVRILILACAFSLVIEGCQYVFACGSTDVDDLILNILGGMSGYGVYVLTTKFLEPKKYAILISVLMLAVTCTGFYVGDNYKFLFNRPAPSIQGDVREINDEGIVVARIDDYNWEDEAIPSRTRTHESNEQFQVEFSENCKITLVSTQPNGKAIEKVTIAKNDISLNDLIVFKQFLITENGNYMVKDIEVHRVQ